MKLFLTKTTLTLAIISVVTGLTTACASLGEPRIIVVTATPQPTSVLATATPQPAPIVELAVAPTPAVESPMVPILEQAGILLKGSKGDLFYLTADGTRRQIYDSGTLHALGLARAEVITIVDDLLETIPVAGPLTRLLLDEQDHLYWVAAGQRWLVDDWKEVVLQSDYAGLPVTPLDKSLQATLLPRAGFEDGTLLRAGDEVYYLVDHALVPVQAGDEAAEKALDIPEEMLAVYEQKAQLEAAAVQLRTEIPAANVRRSPDLQAEVIGTVQSSDQIRVQGRTVDNSWLQISYQGQPGWLAADLVEADLALSLLPPISNITTTTDLPQAEPAAVTGQNEAQPVVCTDVPVRGFGRVWADHLEVQTQLGCPYSWQSNEQSIKAAVQTFQHGVMIWLETDGFYGNDPVYVFFADGTYQRFGDLGEADPAKVGPIPPGFHEIGDKFSKVYWEGTGARVKERLGYAIDPASDSPGAYQQFSNGRMFWLGAIDRIFVILQYIQNPETGNYEPVAQYYSFTDCFEVVCE